MKKVNRLASGVLVTLLDQGGIFSRPRVRLEEDIVLAGECVPAGFISNGADIPFPLNAVLSPFGPWARAAFLHDALLQRGKPRRYSAKKFRLGLIELGLRPWVCRGFYTAVRLWDLFRSVS